MNSLNIWITFTLVLASVTAGCWFCLREKAKWMQLARADGRAEGSIEHARLQERSSHLEREAQNLQRRVTELESSAAANARALQEQRELVSRLNAQVEGANSSVAQGEARIGELTNLESALRGELAREKSDSAAQREIASRLSAQLESARSLGTEDRQRITELTALEGSLREHLSRREATVAELREEGGRQGAELDSIKSQNAHFLARQAEIESERDALREEAADLRTRNAELQTALSSERVNSQEKLKVLQDARDEMTTQFRALSSDIMEEKSRKFTEQNAVAIGQILTPIKEQFMAFQGKFEEVYRIDGQERTAIGEQLKRLIDVNQTLSADAQNLTRALKGDQKTQGTWGEIVLDTVLEHAGLVEGMHYDRQPCLEAEDQRRSIPDIVLRLPGDKQLVIDAKVSLTAYERAASAQSSDEREVHVKQHLTSIRNHIRALSERNYQQLYQLNSLDFVLMFVPLEPAFALAVGNDNQMFREAWDRNVILVSPSTLLFVVRTVAYLWRQESQARNVMEIARRGALLYDKLCGFVEDLEEVRKRIQQTGKAYDAAMRKLSVGDGNLIGQAEKLRDLGVKPTKQLPMTLVDRAMSKAQQSLIEGNESTGDSSEHSGDSMSEIVPKAS